MRHGLDLLPESPEKLQKRLAALACERQRLREAGVSHEVLEQNRLEIARYQSELSHALIRRHLGYSAERAA